jgi:hypothetical protein
MITRTPRVLQDADPNDKSEVFRQLGLKLTYHPGRGIVEAEVQPAPGEVHEVAQDFALLACPPSVLLASSLPS